MILNFFWPITYQFTVPPSIMDLGSQPGKNSLDKHFKKT